MLSFWNLPSICCPACQGLLLDRHSHLWAGSTRDPTSWKGMPNAKHNEGKCFKCFRPFLHMSASPSRYWFPDLNFHHPPRCALLRSLPGRLPVITHGAWCAHRTFWKHASKVSRRHHVHKRALGSTCSNTIPRESLGLNGHDRRRQ